MPKVPNSPPSVDALYDGVAKALDTQDSVGRKVGDCKCGVYLFYDHDCEPIYVGQTRESLRTRIRRHLTNQRTDAVAMYVLDPLEVAKIEMWPYWEDPGKDMLDEAEFSAYCKAIENSGFATMLNEKMPKKTDLIVLPESFKVSILQNPDSSERAHPDIRLARRAQTIANLARVISQRRVQPGIRRTLWALAIRLEALAKQRFEAIKKNPE